MGCSFWSVVGAVSGVSRVVHVSSGEVYNTFTVTQCWFHRTSLRITVMYRQWEQAAFLKQFIKDKFFLTVWDWIHPRVGSGKKNRCFLGVTYLLSGGNSYSLLSYLALVLVKAHTAVWLSLLQMLNLCLVGHLCFPSCCRKELSYCYSKCLVPKS